MKQLSYKTEKWEKRKAILIKHYNDEYEEINLLKKDYLEGGIDEIRYRSTLSLYLMNIAEDEFVQGNFSKCNEYIANALNELVISIKLLKEGKSTSKPTLLSIEKEVEGGYFGYLALIVSNYDAIPQVTKPNSSLLQMLSKQEVTDSPCSSINVMENAISLGNSDKFNEALADRMKEIRRFNLDNYICADFIAMGLVKEARRAGMDFYSEYVEIDMKER